MTGGESKSGGKTEIHLSVGSVTLSLESGFSRAGCAQGILPNL